TFPDLRVALHGAQRVMPLGLVIKHHAVDQLADGKAFALWPGVSPLVERVESVAQESLGSLEVRLARRLADLLAVDVVSDGPCRQLGAGTTALALEDAPSSRTALHDAVSFVGLRFIDEPPFELGGDGKAARSRCRAHFAAESRSARAAAWRRRSSPGSRKTVRRTRCLNSGGRPIRAAMDSTWYTFLRHKINPVDARR